MLLELFIFAAVVSCFEESDNMSSSPPPRYYGTTTESEKPATFSEKPFTLSENSTGSRSYHLLLERRKKSVMTSSGLWGAEGTIDDRNAAITISDNATLKEVRKEVWRLYKKAWPAILGQASLENYCVVIDMQYTAQGGGVYGRISILESEGDAFWDFRKRNDINIINFGAYCAPRQGEAPGKVRSPFYQSQRLKIDDKKLQGRTEFKKGSKNKHHCILQ